MLSRLSFRLLLLISAGVTLHVGHSIIRAATMRGLSLLHFMLYAAPSILRICFHVGLRN